MARECKRKRNERRFGRPERLADSAISTPAGGWLCHPGLPTNPALQAIECLRAEIASAAVIVADNVSKYYWEQAKDYWTYKNDFPCVAPPFDKLFIEYATPKVYVLGDETRPIRSDTDRQGMLIEYIDAAGKPFPRPVGTGSTQSFRWAELPGARWYVRAMPVFRSRSGTPVYGSMLKYFAVDSSGRIIEDPHLVFTQAVSGGLMEDLSAGVGSMLIIALLAISFMHCKNTVLTATDPPREFNRERKKAGLKPFVRFHTIDIEPMKRVLRTEGRVETVGLRKALHIVRGHFATYSEDRPLFGKVAGTFWVPAHVRGSLDGGAVVSDYRVGAPRP